MRILFVSDIYSIHTVRWVNALASRGHEVHLASRDPDKAPVHKIADQVVLHSLGHYRKIASIKAGFVLRKLARQIRPDIINAHFASSYGLTARIAGAHPLLLNVWGSDVYAFPYKSLLNRQILKGNLLAADRIASTSEVMARQVRKLLGNDQLPIDITPFGVDVDRFCLARDYQHQENGAFIIGLVKTLKPVYGIEYLVRSIPLLLGQLHLFNPELAQQIRLHIYGEGPLESSLKDLVAKLGLSQIVSFKGYVEHSRLPEILSDMDLYCLSSLQESFGVSAIEAMASGLPIVATDTEGFRDIIRQEETGLLVPPADPQALANAMFKLCSDQSLRQSYGQAGLQRVKKLFDWEQNVTTMEQIYQEMVSRGAKSPGQQR